MNGKLLHKKLVEDALAQGGELELDLRNPEHYEYIMSTLYKEKGMNALAANEVKQSALYEFIQAERNKPYTKPKQALKNAADSEGYTIGPNDTAYVTVPVMANQSNVSGQLKGQQDDENIASQVVGSYTRPQAAVLVNASLYNVNTEEQVGSCVANQKDTNYVVVPMVGNVGALVGKEDNKYETSAVLISVGEDDSNNTVMNARMCANDQFYVLKEGSFITNFEMHDPVIKDPNRGNKEVRVSYKRDSNMGYFDYSFDNEPENNSIKLLLPVEFEVEVDTKLCSIVGLDEDLGFRLYFQHPDGGLVKYYYMGKQSLMDLKFKYNEGKKCGMVVKLDYDWRAKLPFADLEGGVSAKLDIYGQFNVLVKVDNFGTFPISISFKSNGTSFDTMNISVPQIFMQWGCFGKDSMIAMADGTEKRVSELSVGEYVLSWKGKPCEIRDIITGFEKEIYQIYTRSGKEIKLTNTHSICIQQDGESKWICVCDLRGGQKVVMEQGVEEVSFIDIIPYQDKVYNLMFDEETPIYSNGFLVGDYAMQQRIRPKRDQIEFSEKTKKIAEELYQLYEN